MVKKKEVKQVFLNWYKVAEHTYKPALIGLGIAVLDTVVKYLAGLELGDPMYKMIILPVLLGLASGAMNWLKHK